MSDSPAIKSCEEYFQRYQVDAVLWRADLLLGGVDNSILRNEAFEKIAYTISLLPQVVAREDYTVKIAKKYDLQPAVLRKMVAAAIDVRKRQDELKRTVRKNKVPELGGNAKTYPFFSEVVKKDGSFDRISINKVRYVKLLQSFGFARYEVGDNEKYTFVRIKENVIQQVNQEEIIDYLEKFITDEYDFEGAGMMYADPEKLINKLYEGIVFNKKLFGRLRAEAPIIINRDKAGTTYLYYKNGFVEINAEGYQLRKYDEMEGSVWDHQVNDRIFRKIDDPVEILCEDTDQDQRNYKSDFVDFCWKISGRDVERFKALCCIIGYLVHDYYQYTLKLIYFTDSTISEHSQGRTGKTLLLKLIGNVRSYVEIPGKHFNPADEKRYQLVKLGTQLVHINDVDTKGRNKFTLEPMFNDITEGLQVRALYLPPFVQYSKLAASGNDSLFVEGDSARDRLVEFEMSNFFSMDRRPVDYYGHRLGDAWDADAWNQFDNFICFCSMMFHRFGLIQPPTINLAERKLLQNTAVEFIDFMSERIKAAQDTGSIAEFDCSDLFEEFRKQYQDFNNPHFKQRTFNRWLKLYGDTRHRGKFTQRRSNGKTFVKYD